MSERQLPCGGGMWGVFDTWQRRWCPRRGTEVEMGDHAVKLNGEHDPSRMEYRFHALPLPGAEDTVNRRYCTDCDEMVGPEHQIAPGAEGLALSATDAASLAKVIDAARDACCDTHHIPACVELAKALYAYDLARGAVCPSCKGSGTNDGPDDDPGEGESCDTCGGKGLVEPAV